MRIFLVINETHFYMPNFIAEFLRQTGDHVAGAALVTRIPAKNDMDSYLKRNFYYLRPLELIKLSLTDLFMTVQDRLWPKGLRRKFYSVRAVFESFGINYFEVQDDINQKKYLDQIKLREPDVIISCNALIFKEEILRLPRICCLNRHSALLPSYRGLWPVFQACRNGEKSTGVSVHTMDRLIDRGIILSQREVPIRPGDTVTSLYDKCYQASVEALLEALNRVRRKDFYPHYTNGAAPSYFSFPTREHWREFRQRGGRFI